MSGAINQKALQTTFDLLSGKYTLQPEKITAIVEAFTGVIKELDIAPDTFRSVFETYVLADEQAEVGWIVPEDKERCEPIMRELTDLLKDPPKGVKPGVYAQHNLVSINFGQGTHIAFRISRCSRSAVTPLRRA